LKRRPNILIFMQILELLSEGPRGPTSLSQACGLNYAKLREFADKLQGKSLIRMEVVEGHETYFLTSEGLQVLNDLTRAMVKLGD
jgi:predicted transcriptional regulator